MLLCFFVLLCFVVVFLTRLIELELFPIHRCGNIEVVIQYAKWALDKNQEMAARIFTERVEGEKSEQLEPHFLLDFLKPYPDATLVYLEYLINDRKLIVRIIACGSVAMFQNGLM